MVQRKVEKYSIAVNSRKIQFLGVNRLGFQYFECLKSCPSTHSTRRISLSVPEQPNPRLRIFTIRPYCQSLTVACRPRPSRRRGACDCPSPTANRSHQNTSTSSSAAPPVRSDSLRRTGYRLDLRSPAPGRRRRRAGGAVLVQDDYQAGHAGVCSTPHRNHHHVAPRSATTLASECCTCEVQAAHA